MSPVIFIGEWGGTILYVIHFILGFGFGFILERAGFGNANVLANQFYFRDMTVLKVMFTAIITSMILMMTSSAIGLIDLDLVWVNPTYLMPGIIGGVIMGVGFVIGGYCPGTSLVSLATGKLDGLFFIVGILIGIFAFGETVDSFSTLWLGGDMGRYTLDQWMGVSKGVAVLFAVILALVFFKGGEALENNFSKVPRAKLPIWAVIGFLVATLPAILISQPTALEKWEKLDDKAKAVLSDKSYQIQPGEFLELWSDDALELHIIDLRSEEAWNRIHFPSSEKSDVNDFADIRFVEKWTKRPANAVFVLIGEDDDLELAYKTLKGHKLHNLYALEGGFKAWLTDFKAHHHYRASASSPEGYILPGALGSEREGAIPDRTWLEGISYEKRVKLELKKAAAGGGCG